MPKYGEWIARIQIPELICRDLWAVGTRHCTPEEVRKELKCVFSLAEKVLDEAGIENVEVLPAWFRHGLTELLNDGRYERTRVLRNRIDVYHEGFVRTGAFFTSWAVEQWEMYYLERKKNDASA